MPGWLAGWRKRYGRPSPRLWRIWLRSVTLLGGLALGLAALLALTLFSRDVATYPPPRLEVEAERLGPMTAVQPALRRALITEDDLPPAAGSPESSDLINPSPAAGVTGPTSGPPAGVEESLTGPPECRGLLGEGPAFTDLWPPPLRPDEIISRDTPRPGGSVLRQVLTVFEEEIAPDAFTHVRDIAAGCEEFTMWWEGEVVTVALDDLRIGALWPRVRESRPHQPPPAPLKDPERHENRDWGQDRSREPALERSAPEPPGPGQPAPDPEPGQQSSPPRLAPSHLPESQTQHPGAGPIPDQTHVLSITVQRPVGAPLVGWLAVDRVGPVVSLLHQLGPAESLAGGPVETRRVALGKLRPLVRMLDR